MEKELFKLQDLKYRDFNSKLIPNISKDTMIGVRTPELRKYAKRIKDIKCFIEILPHKYFEENMLHAILLARVSDDINVTLDYVDRFLPYVDNWCVCDTISIPIYKKYPKEVFTRVLQWINSGKTYTIRYGIDVLLEYFLDECFDEDHLKIVSSINTNEYYVKMAIAWYYSFALIKQYESTIKYFQKPILDPWIHNKSIQKAIESYRIDDKTKEYLRTLKVRK